MAIAKKAAAKKSAKPAPGGHPWAGRYVIVRACSAGVHAGVLRAVTGVGPSGDTVILDESRRLWSWTARAGVALSGIAVHGLKSGRVDAPAENEIRGVIEIIPCSATSEASIRGTS